MKSVGAAPTHKDGQALSVIARYFTNFDLVVANFGIQKPHGLSAEVLVSLSR